MAFVLVLAALLTNLAAAVRVAEQSHAGEVTASNATGPRDAVYRPVRGWALFCRNGCNVIQEPWAPPHSDVIDSMDITEVAYAYVLAEDMPGVWTINVCDSDYNTPVMDPDEILSGRCHSIRDNVGEDTLMNLPDVSEPYDPPFMLFRGKQVRDMYHLVQVVEEEFSSSQPEALTQSAREQAPSSFLLDGMPRFMTGPADSYTVKPEKTRWRGLTRLTKSLFGRKNQGKKKKPVVDDEDEDKEVEELAEDQLAVERARAKAFRAGLLFQADRLMEAKEELRKLEVKMVTDIVSSEGKIDLLADLLADLKIKLADSLERANAPPAQCEVLMTTEEAKAIREVLDANATAHRAAEKSALKDIAVQTFEITFAALELAADANVPGLGTLVKTVRSAGMGAVQAAQAFTNPAIQSGMSTMLGALNDLQAQVDSIPGLAEAQRLAESLQGDVTSMQSEGASGSFPSIPALGLSDPEQTVLGAGEGGFTDTIKGHIQDAFSGGAAEAWKNKKVQLPKLPSMKDVVGVVKSIMSEALMAAATEAAWSAAEFIPIIGPFMGIARQFGKLLMTVKDAMKEHVEYLKKKDPILRSLFRLRDCTLDALLHSGATEMARNRKVPRAKRQASLMSAIDASLAAVDLNQDLTARLHKQVWTLGSKNGHEKKVMLRLQTGRTSAWVMENVKPDAEMGDNFLPETELEPTRWQRVAGELITRDWERMHNVK